jgi:hypothetical protein
VQRVPEGWATPSYWTVIISLGNILPLALVAYNHRSRPQDGRLRHEVPVIYAVLVMQLVACVLLMFTWDTTAYNHRLVLSEVGTNHIPPTITGSLSPVAAHAGVASLCLGLWVALGHIPSFHLGV